MTLYCQGSPDSTRSNNPVEDLKAYKYKVKNVEYVMFLAEDYRKLLSLGREYAILLDIQDSLWVKHQYLDIQVQAYILKVNQFQSIADSLEIEIVDLKANFDDYSEQSEKKLSKLYNKNKRLRKGLFIVTTIALVETIILILAITK